MSFLEDFDPDEAKVAYMEMKADEENEAEWRRKEAKRRANKALKRKLAPKAKEISNE